MTKLKEAMGTCLCGAVRFVVSDVENAVGACHCGSCRKWAGGPFMEVECGTNIRFEGVDSIRTYQSSPWAERGFCGHCGTHLYMRVRPGNEFGLPEGYGIPPGLFGDNETFTFTGQVFIDQKPEYYSFENATTNITSAEIYQRFPAVRGTPTRG